MIKEPKTEKSFQISVIVPMYNTGKYLGECLDSVLGQILRYPEIIINDGSPDNSESVCLEYAAKDPASPILNKKVKGLSLARGEYVYSLDSDVFLDSLYMLGTLNIFIRRSFWGQNPLLRFPKGIQPCEDGILGHMRLTLLDKVSLCYFYRQHAIQSSQNRAKNSEYMLKTKP